MIDEIDNVFIIHYQYIQMKWDEKNENNLRSTSKWVTQSNDSDKSDIWRD